MRELNIFEREINVENIESDFFYSFFHINSFINEEIYRILVNESLFCSQKVSRDVNVYIKDNFLCYILIHEFNIAEKAGLLPDEHENNKLKSFVLLTCEKEWLDYLFEKYTYLKSRLTKLINNILIFIQEFYKNWNKDKEIIYKTFNIGDRVIKKINLFKGDLHCEGRSVASIIFNDNTIIYYKPRNSYNELFLKEFLNFLNEKNKKIVAKIPEIISFENYSWMSHLNYSNNFQNVQEVRDFYTNWGKLACVFYLFGSTDIIPDNVLISENKISFFDLEALFYRVITEDYNASTNGVFQESIIKTGILPTWMEMYSQDVDKPVLSSPLFRINNQNVEKLEIIRSEKSFSVETVNSEKSNEPDLHIPMLRGNYEELNEPLKDYFKSGFISIYRFILENKSLIENYLKKKLHGAENQVRVIFHNTAVYSQLYRESTVPEVFVDQGKFKELIDSFSNSYSNGFDVDRDLLFKSIYEQILDGDIPFFFFKIKFRKLKDGKGNVLNSNYSFNVLNSLLQRLNNFSEDNLKIQLNIIDWTCELAFDHFNIKTKKSFVNIQDFKKNSEVILSNDELKLNLLQVAKLIADDLLDKTIEYENKVNWISKVILNPSHSYYSIGTLNLGLYDGVSGVCLFFQQLYECTKEEKYKSVSEKIFSELTDILKQKVEQGFYRGLNGVKNNNVPLTIFDFPLSYIYLFFQSKNFKNQANWELIESVLEEISVLIESASIFDYVTGILSLVDVLMSGKKELLNFTREEKLDYLIKKLLKIIMLNSISSDKSFTWTMTDREIEREIGGFGHGSTSVAYVFMKAFNLYGDFSYKKFAFDALNHDRSFFRDDLKLWKDNRALNKDGDSFAWCHGSAGIGLGRLLLMKYFNDSEINQEITYAMKNIIKTLNGSRSQSICHGDLGNLEILKAIAVFKDDKVVNDFVNHYLAFLCEQFKSGNHFKVGANGKSNIIGLFLGQSGFGYQLLRFSNWEITPSVLCLEFENNLNNILHETI